MDETQDQSVARPASPEEHNGHRRPVRGKMRELEGRWLMGRVAPREMLEGIGRFRVVRTGDPLAPDTDALDRRFGGGQAAV
jgi:hypothetical protein